MFITMVSPECAPVAKAGGLGDFVQGLAREVAIRGNAVEIILPKYDCLRFDRVWGMHKIYRDLWVPFHDRAIHCDVEYGEVDGLKCFFIDAHSEHGFFNRGKIYGDADDPERFAFFSRAVMEFLYKSGKRPDVIHCNDWQTGLVPVLLFELYAGLGMERSRVCYSLHNMGHQGWTGPQVLHMNGLDAARLITPERLQDPGSPGAVNLMKGGIVYANFVTTVSPRYAWEIQHTDQGMGLQGVLKAHDGKFGGVLNGIDYSTWNPEIDSHIATNYGVDSLPKKAANKVALRRRVGLTDVFKPLIAVVSRLDKQKGVELIRHGIYYALEQGCQFVLLGSAPDPGVDARFRAIKHEMDASPDCHLELGYDEELAHLMYAGSDMILIPSVYEPCGLTQMIAMKYGCVPIARRVGGLADTVFDANYSDRPFEERNGYLFDDLTYDGLESALGRAIGLWHRYPEYFRQLRLNGMRMDNSWNRPGQHYLDIYHHIRA
ncbi:MAG: glycogen synthase [Thiohalocapsa sp.]|nr:glycogen synthase [Thiohalocapsa sp.]